tara:strand:+ start:1634 stop:1873 length:240 start_codon:yes stop_codon:yes gene_type:complete
MILPRVGNRCSGHPIATAVDHHSRHLPLQPTETAGIEVVVVTATSKEAWTVFASEVDGAGTDGTGIEDAGCTCCTVLAG